MVVVLMGVTGSGKTTVGVRLSEELGWSFYDADDFHPARNKEKMHAGIPLTDEDRVPWLRALRQVIEGSLALDRDAVVACSALKASYRDVLSKGLDGVKFVLLDAQKDVLAHRLAQRTDHFMNPALLDSQLDTLERPGHALVVDVAAPVSDVVREIRASLLLA